MLPAVLAAALLAAPDATAIVEAELPRSMRGRATYARELVSAAYREGRRRGLDPLALLAIAHVESGWQPWAARKQDGSHGPYQLIAAHPGPVECRALLAGCRGSGEPCEAPEVAQRRRGRTGPWTRAELRDPAIATYLAAYEVQRHVATCYRLRHGPHRAPRECPAWLVKYGHYNSGWGVPRWYYMVRLCRTYAKLRAFN